MQLIDQFSQIASNTTCNAFSHHRAPSPSACIKAPPSDRSNVSLSSKKHINQPIWRSSQTSNQVSNAPCPPPRRPSKSPRAAGPTAATPTTTGCTRSTFSFSSYHDRKYQGLGSLRVINEDRVARSTGFGTHAHAEFLIWSYIVAGELEHRDSLGNVETLKRGDVQFTSAGTGIRHSEYNRNDAVDNHFLQIWAKPSVAGLTPSYVTRAFPDELKKDRLLRIMESVARAKATTKTAEGGADPAPIPLHADLSMDASILSPGASVSHEPVAAGERKLYLHVVMRGRSSLRPALTARGSRSAASSSGRGWRVRRGRYRCACRGGECWGGACGVFAVRCWGEVNAVHWEPNC